MAKLQAIRLFNKADTFSIPAILRGYKPAIMRPKLRFVTISKSVFFRFSRYFSGWNLGFFVLRFAVLVLVLETPESIQVDRLYKEAGTPVFGPHVIDIPIRPFEYGSGVDATVWLGRLGLLLLGFLLLTPRLLVLVILELLLELIELLGLLLGTQLDGLRGPLDRLVELT